MFQSQVDIFETASTDEANRVKNLLEQADIPAILFYETPKGSLKESSVVKVLIDPEFISEAQEIVDHFRAKVDPVEPQEDDVEYQGDAEPIYDPLFAWPTCAECGEPRITVCPYCDMSGSDFPFAYGDPPPTLLHQIQPAISPVEGAPNEAGSQDVAVQENISQDGNSEDNTTQEMIYPNPYVVCSTCDEPFVAEFFRNCTWCNHDFGNGKPSPESQPLSLMKEIQENPRILVVIGGLVGVCVLLFLIASYGAR